MTLQPFTVIALRADRTPVRIGLPDHVVGACELEPQWQDDPA